MNSQEEMLNTAEPAGDVYVLPASLGQERYWDLDRLNPGNPTWAVPVRFRLEGDLNPAWLERAFQEIVRRHEIWRSTFVFADGQLSQVIHPSLEIKVPVTDLRQLPKEERNAEADRLSLAEARWRFDLTCGPLLRVGLIRMEDNEYILLVNAHHSVTDYWSVGILSQELGALYEAYSRGQDGSLPELPIQYADFSVWQREQAETPLVKAELADWEKQLANLPPLEFPTDHPRGAEPTFNATITSILLPVTLTDAVRDIATGCETTFFNAAFAALSVVLHGYTGQTDFGIATQIAGRNSVETEPLIGPFINTVVLRPDLSGDPTFRELLVRVRETALQSLEKNNVRFEQVLKKLRPAEYPSHHSLFQMNFICQRDPVKPQEFAGVKLTVIPSKSQGALYDLHVFLIMRNEGWRLACEYNTDLFDAPTITQLLVNYKSVLEQIAADPQRPISGYTLPNAPQRAASIEPPAPAAPVVEEAKEESAETFAFPITIAQQRFWLLEQLMPGNPTLNMPAAMRLKGTLDMGTLYRALNDVVKRHEGLRATFSTVDGQPMQVIHPSVIVPVVRIDLQELPEAEREAKAEQHLREEASHGFVLSRAPLIRATVLQLAADHHLLMITMPHILCDGWSAGIVIREVAALYEAYSSGRPSPLEPLAVEYADFAHWQTEWLKGNAFQEELEYWKKQLQGRLPLLDLPADKPVPSKLVSPGDTETLVLPAELVGKIKELCKREEITMFMFFLAIFKTMLHRYTGQEDILVGSPVAGRSPETEGVVGLFSYPISLRTEVKGELRFRDLLDRVRDATLGALAHKDLPFGVLVEELKVEQVQGRNPLFQVYFLHQTGFLQPLEMPGLSWTPVTWLSPVTSFDLHLATLERRGSVVARLEYNTDIFKASTIRQMLGHLQTIVQAVVADAGAALAELPLLTEAERQAFSPSHPKASFTEEPLRQHLLPELLGEHSQVDPSRLAAVSAGRKLSYAELDSQVSQLAERLCRFGLRPGVVAGIGGSFSSDLLISLLAVLRTGAAYAWLDSSGAGFAERLAASGARLVILPKHSHAPALPAGVSAVYLDDGTAQRERESRGELPLTVAPDTACIQFSSGEPAKAVLVSRPALAARAAAAAATAGLVSEDRVGLTPSNASLEMLLGCAWRGATAVLASAQLPDSEFLHFAEKQRCTILAMPTSRWQRLAFRKGKSPKNFHEGVRLVMIYGERPSLAAITEFRKLAGERVRCLASFGAAEAGANAAVYEIGSVADGEEPVTLGNAAPGMAVRIRDRYLQQLPSGVPGEICVEGEMLASGLAKTSDGTPVFRTGDWGRYLSDGRIEFLGPARQHVNLRGFRLHLGELEAQLLRHPGVCKAAAISSQDASGDERPAVYVVPAESGGLSKARETGLRRQLQLWITEHCPQYPLPSVIVFTDALPVDVQGRVLRAALVPPDAVKTESRNAFEPPRNELEAQLVRIWEDVLGVHPIGITDNFFDLHGHSLLAVRLFARIRTTWGRNLPLSILFQVPTIERLAEVLRQEVWSPSWSSLVTIQAGGSRPPLFIVSGLGGNVVRFRDLARYLGEDQPVYALQPPGMDGSRPYLTRIEDMAAHYVREVKAKQPEGPYQLAGYSFGGLVVFEMARQFAAQGDPVGLTALLDAPEWGYISKTAKNVSAGRRWQRIQARFTRLLRGPDRWEYLSEAMRQRVSRLVFKASAVLGRPIPQRFGTLSDINAHAAAQYVPQVYPGQLTLLRTRPDPGQPQGDYQLGWGRLAAGGVAVHEITGAHLEITDEPNVQVLAEKLRLSLDQVDSSSVPAIGHGAAEPSYVENVPAGRSILGSCA